MLCRATAGGALRQYAAGDGAAEMDRVKCSPHACWATFFYATVPSPRSWARCRPSPQLWGENLFELRAHCGMARLHTPTALAVLLSVLVASESYATLARALRNPRHPSEPN